MRARSEKGTDTLVSMLNYKHSASLEFRALISDGVERLELIRV
jgi:hypothetical protein